MPQDELRAKALHSFYQQYGLRAGGYLALLLLLGMLMQRLVMRPLKHVDGVVSEFGSGNMNARAMLPGNDEVSRLAQSFDRMAEEIANNSEAQHKMNRELRAISNCNQTLMRATDEQTLLNDICRIVCDEAGYRMAWVGYAERDEAKTIRSVARAGVEEGYLEQAMLTWADTERGRGPAGTAIRSGQCTCIQDFSTEPQATPWRDNALQRGYRSAIILPLKDGSANTFGILTIYSVEPNAFNPEEIQLLEELAGDLAFGIVTIRSRAERKLLELQKDQYLRFFTLSTEAMCIADPFGCFKQVNPALVLLTGYSEGELVTKPFLDFVHPDDRQRTADEMKRQVAVRPSLNFENRYVCKDGSVILLSWTAYFDKSDGFTYATARDITESRKLEEAIAANEKEFQLLAEAMPQIVWVTRADGWNTYINQQWVEYTGLTLAESYGHGWNKPFHPDDRQRAWDAWQNAVNSNGIYSLDCRLRRADGVYRWWLIRGVPVLDEHGKTYKWFGTCTDIDDIKQAENELRNVTSYTRSLIEASLDPLVTISPEGKITDVNRMTEEVTGIARTELIGTDFADYFTEPEQARAGYKMVLAQGYVRDYPLTIHNRSGRTTDVLYNAVVYRSETGVLKGVFAAARDITERKLAQAALQQSEKDLKEAQRLAKIGSWNWDMATDTITWSEEYYRIFGFDQTQHPPGYEDHLKAYTPESAARLDAAVKRTTQTGEPYELDLELAHREGLRRWITARSETRRDAQGQIIELRGTAQDITERKQAEQSLERANRALRTLSASNMALVHAENETELLDTVCRLIVEMGGYRMAWVGFPEHDPEKTVRPVAHYGHEEGFLEETKRSWAADTELGRGPVGTAIRTGAVQVNQNTQTDPALALWREAGLKRGYQSGTTLPLQGSTGILGALTICASEPDAFNETEVTLLKELADDLSFGIETLRTRAERDRNAYEHEHHQEILRKSLEQSIQAIAATVEARDPYTAGHQQRVTELTGAIAREMGLAEERIHGMRLAASIHDLGKIKVPAEILSKPGKLTALEFKLIQVHPQSGYDILKDIEFPWPIADIVHQHHEKLDGSGYPQGLKDGQILLESRILAVADVLEAMASHRPYRAALGIESALKEIERGRGSIYDPVVADTCLRLFREGKLVFPQ
ncbi:PAS domain S-box protein [Georgfuchsia toluolica]|uniref:PAS domain S-box protein n=1 Tax=Georgfuchsia toluolica TaxID=424218 RepID=UPI001FE4D524|nr:PAS domain S-box protein [Georgfuchsia toluolica]